MQTFIALDVAYHDINATAQAAGIVFHGIAAAQASQIYRKNIDNIAPYQAGQLYKRELPCLLTLLADVQQAYDYIIIDGNVYLDQQQRAGLGAYLYAALAQSTPIIGVAKSPFAGLNTPEHQLWRGNSTNPLIITAIGMDLHTARTLIAQMHGKHRIPTLLKQVDALSRQSNH